MSKSPVERLLDTVEWKPVIRDESYVPGDLPYVVKTGILKIGNVELECVVLNTGDRIFPEESLRKLFGDDLDHLIAVCKEVTRGGESL